VYKLSVPERGKQARAPGWRRVRSLVPWDSNVSHNSTDSTRTDACAVHALRTDGSLKSRRG